MLNTCARCGSRAVRTDERRIMRDPLSVAKGLPAHVFVLDVCEDGHRIWHRTSPVTVEARW